MSEERILFVRCPKCLAWTVCASGAPGGPALCEHPSSSYLVLAGGVLDLYVDCGAVAALKGNQHKLDTTNGGTE